MQGADSQKNIIIVGAGFGGITAALKLVKNLRHSPEYKLWLIDKYHHQLFTPALYEIAAIPKETTSDLELKSSVLIPISDIIGKNPIGFICDELTGVDKTAKKILLKKGGELNYEFLILALGSETGYFDIPGLEKYSFPLKTFDDGVRLRNAIEERFTKKANLKVIVGGAGASGVELIAEFVNFTCELHEKIFSAKGGSASGGKQKVCAVEFLLIEATPDILPGFNAWAVAKTKKRIEELGIRIKTGATITSVDENSVTLNNEVRESYDILIWTGGIKGPQVLDKSGFPLSPKGTLIVDEYLRVQGEEKIFAAGDNTNFTNQETKKPLPGNVPVAEAEGRIAAKNVLRSIYGKPLKKYKPMKKYPLILVISRKYAIADLIFLRFSGFWGWLAKQLVELRYFLFVLPPMKAIKTWLKGIKYFTSND